MALTAAVCTVVALKGDRAALAPALSLVLLVPLNMFNQMRLAPLRVGQFLRLWNLLRLLPALTYASLILGLAVTRELTVSTGCIAVVLGSMHHRRSMLDSPGGNLRSSPAGAEPAPRGNRNPRSPVLRPRISYSPTCRRWPISVLISYCSDSRLHPKFWVSTQLRYRLQEWCRCLGPRWSRCCFRG